ncbi:Protein kinase domain containing protein [Musa troglodytarum]|uniref:Protein kinase domain containing protein n=1 Tax=Musa troglodytarum TaxID=320322 RepID=A0A9E7GMC5_9LILI|nr:Protein kinase domain containing protein [Musa troglodytarum]
MTPRHPRRLPSRLASQSAHRRSPFPKRYVLAETKTTPAVASSNSSTNRSSSEHHHSRSHKQGARNWIVGFITGSLAGIVSGAQIKRAEDLAFLEKDDGLAALEVIGRGGCGEVYKAQLPPDPSKPDRPGMSRLLDKWMRQIRSEIQTVGHIRHRNLLPLLAHVTRPDCHLLIYEFMKNGSLDTVLNSVRDGEREFDWLARYRVALGIASGLEYLHIHHKPQIIHRDLKPANILLDDGMEARIADFGLAKEMPDAHTHITASKVAGTLGYISPEYGQTLRFTAKCDIYSFGVILAVLVVGKMPSDPFFHDTDEISLVRWLRKVMSSANPTAAIDPKLVGNGYDDQMLLVLRIAIFCTVDDPKERPSSKEIRSMLAQIKH